MEAERDLERQAFHRKIEGPHTRINPCFMTGKGCVYTEIIDREISQRKVGGSYAGFLIIPFQPNITTFFELSFKRYVYDVYKPDKAQIDLLRADQIRRPGYVICEKICKKIQESDFVVADISVPNANVFYELGLAYGSNQKIIVTFHDKAPFGATAVRGFEDGGCTPLKYSDLNPLTTERFALSRHVWQRRPSGLGVTPASPQILLVENYEETDGGTSAQNAVKEFDISLDFSSHVMAAVGVSIANIVRDIRQSDTSQLLRTYLPLIEGMKSAVKIESDLRFQDVQQRIEQAYCIVIRTGGKGCSPLSYFWLGYCHALGKNVIPVTVLNSRGGSIDDLAFDIRSLWHMTFIREEAERLANEVQEILQRMIVTDFSEWSRRALWEEIIGRRGKVSIFTGALHNDRIGREMIGDWDLRAASELTSYFASHQYRATIESPIYQIEQAERRGVKRRLYTEELKSILKGKNCVIIGSADVNPLTEIVLGGIYGLPEKEWFDGGDITQKLPSAVVAVKEKATSDQSASPQHAFYQETAVASEKPTELKRGFKCASLRGGGIMGRFVSQTEVEQDYVIHAHLVIAPHPFDPERYVIVLNGVSGPATFALTHVLTGGVSKEFVSYGGGFLPEPTSEDDLAGILRELELVKHQRRRGIQCFFEVQVGPGKEDQGGSAAKIFDWRHIRGWKLLEIGLL